MDILGSILSGEFISFFEILGSEGGTSHGNFFGDDLPNPKTAEMSQITAGNSLSASKSGETSRSTHFNTF